MEGKKFKMVIQIRGYETAAWLNIVYETIKGLNEAKKGKEETVK
jgi:transcription-repair coupling factor (superfamily II helicase)